MSRFGRGVAGALLGLLGWFVIFILPDLLGIGFLFGGALVSEAPDGTVSVQPFGLLMGLICLVAFPVIGARVMLGKD